MTADDVLEDFADRDIVLHLDAGRLRYSAPPGALTDDDRAAIAAHRPALLALLAEPTEHCQACGSPSFWRSPTGWRCAYCEPRPGPFTGESHVIDSGRWRAGTHPPIPEPVTVADVLATHGPLLVAGTIRTADVLAEADPDDLPDFLDDRAALEGFARALVADRRIRPLPDPDLPPLPRLALELGDDVDDLREYLDRTAVGRALREHLERKPAAVDRALLGLRADPDGGLLPVPVPAVPRSRTDDRVQNAYGAWRTPAEHAAVAAFDAHHWTCPVCRRAGRGYGERCQAGAALHALTRTTTPRHPK